MIGRSPGGIAGALSALTWLAGAIGGAALPPADAAEPYAGKQEQMEQIIRHAHATPKALVERAAELNGSGGP